MISQDDLDLVATDDLILALRRRYDIVVFAGTKNMGKGRGEDYCLRYTDHSFRALGLTKFLEDAISSHAAQCSGPATETLNNHEGPAADTQDDEG